MDDRLLAMVTQRLDVSDLDDEVGLLVLAACESDDAPRGMNILYDLRRFKVAVSRACAISVVIASQSLLNALCRTSDQVPLANAVCRYKEISGG